MPSEMAQQKIEKTSRTLIIGIDVRALEIESSRKRGIGRYLYNLLDRMINMNPEIMFRLYGQGFPWELSHLRSLLDASNVEYRTFHPSFAEELNVFLITDPLPVMKDVQLFVYPVGAVPCVTIIYDLIPLAYANEYLETNPQIHQQYLEKLSALKYSVKRYLTISNFVAEDLAQRVNISKQNIVPILGGLDMGFTSQPEEKKIEETMNKFKIDSDYFLYIGGVDYRKNVQTLIKAFKSLRKTCAKPVKLVLVGEANANWLKKTLIEYGLDRNVEDIILPGYVTDDELNCLYSEAKAFIFPSLYEGFGLPALEAMASGCPVIASNSSSLAEIVGNSGLLIDPNSSESIRAAMLRLLQEKDLVDELRAKGYAHARQYAWEDVAVKTINALKEIATRPQRTVAPTRRMHILLQNRNNAFSCPGGDTIVSNEIYSGLRALDVDVDVATGAPDLGNVDLVHVMNVTLSSMLQEAAENATKQNVPYVITTLYEDWQRYMERSALTVNLFQQYLSSGNNEQAFQRGLAHIRSLPDGPKVGNHQSVYGAAALFACGESEADRIRDDYPEAYELIKVVKFGNSRMKRAPEFLVERVKEYLGFDRFLICCGRIETRKNQLMLLKAFEDSDLPIVLASGGFSYQPVYVELVQKYKRKGLVRILPRIGFELLEGIMSAASVHVLPSWYELPGLVTLEAASCGIPVVASDWGAVTDYLPEGLIELCQPDDPRSIYDAVERALAKGVNPQTKVKADSYTWQAFAEETYNTYERILSSSSKNKSCNTIQNQQNYSDIAPTEAPMTQTKKNN